MREDVSAVLFDEPLTVIDPHLKWQLRRKLKQIHHELKLTLIYVTHDQVEALTFADQVVVMTRGRAVQVGSAVELFERPAHTFVGHFIGSPGMNFLPARWDGDGVSVAGHALGTQPASRGARRLPASSRSACGLSTCSSRARAARRAAGQVRQGAGHRHLLARHRNERRAVIRARLSPEARPPAVGEEVWLNVLGTHTCFYKNEELIA